MAAPVVIVVTVQSRGAMTGFQLVQLAARRMANNVQSTIRRMSTNIGGRWTQAVAVFRRGFQAIGSMAGRVAQQLADMAPAIREGAQAFGLSAGRMAAMLAVGIHLLPTLIDLTGIITLLPAALAGAGAAMLVMKLATNGMGDAINDALTDWNKWEKSAKGMPRWTHDFIAAIVLIRNAWKPLQKAVQNRFFRELGADLMELNAQYLPVFSRWLPRIADSMNGAIRKTLNWLESSERVARVEGIMRNISAAIGSIGRVIQPIVSILLDLAEVGAPRLASLSDTLGTLAEKAATWITKMKDDGSIGRWLDKAITAFGDLRGIVSDLMGVLAAMYQGATTDGETFLAGVHAQTTAMKEWAESAEGQQAIDDFSTAGGIILQILQVVTQSFLGLTYIVRAIYRAFNEFLIFILYGMNAILQAAARAFGWMPGIGPQLQQAAAEFNGFVADVNSALNGMQTSRSIEINATATLTTYRNVIETTTSRISARASGGLATGLVKVGERGTEILDLGARGGRVRNAGDTRQMLAAGAGGGRPTAGSATGGAGNSMGIAAGAMTDLLRYLLNGPVKAYADPGTGRVRLA